MGNRFDRSARAQRAIARLESASEETRPFFGRSLPRRVHLVLQGGGTLGIAHLGFVYGLERIGVSFAGLAGTSAGAILALLIAGARGPDIHRKVAEDLLPVLESMPSASFMDGPYLVRRFVNAALSGWQSQVHELALPAMASGRKVLKDYGLHRGQRFSEWLAEVLARQFEISTPLDIELSLRSVATQLDLPPERWSDLLHITATAMPIGIKLVFPKHAHLFDKRYATASPSLWARASMSVPLFFEPLKMKLDRQQWTGFVEHEFAGRYPSRFVEQALELRDISFIDGGLLSNFPIDAFSTFAPSGISTVGVALVPGHIEAPPVQRGGLRAFGKYAGAVLAAVRHLRDREALERTLRDESTQNTTVAFIDTGPHHWLNFSLGLDAMEDLFVRGLEGAVSLIERLPVREGMPA